MNITDVKIRKVFFDESPMKAVVSVTFDDCFALHDVKVINSHEKLFVVMPSRRAADGTFRDIAHPTNSAFRNEVEDAILTAYKEAVARYEAEASQADTDAEEPFA